MLLMKEITKKRFNWNFDDGADDSSDSALIIPEGDYEYGFCVDQNTLQCDLCVRRAIRRRRIERGRPIPPAF